MRIFAREILWFFIALLFAVPLAYLFVHLMNLTPEGIKLSQDERVFQMEFFFTGGFLGVIGVYIMRVIMWSISTLAKSIG